MFPVAFFSGMLFPIIVAEVQASVGDRMNSTGIAALLNTSGAAIGPLVASFVLLPALGYQTSLICCAAGYALLSIIVTERAAWSIAPASRDHPRCALDRIALILGSGIFPISTRRSAFRTCEPPIRKGRPGPCAGARGETDRGNIGHLAVAAARFVWRAVLLPVAERRVLDVGHKSAQSALHAIVRLSSAGVASRGKRCAASFVTDAA